MIKSYQQRQTMHFFNRHALKWFSKAQLTSKHSVNVIKQRNEYVESIATFFLSPTSKTLDIGCGTGDLVINLCKKKFDAYGIDFAPSMIKKARKEAKKYHISPDRFFLNSFFGFESEMKYDLISANGFIEYISEKELSQFISKSFKLLKKNGLLLIGSRNRLFNVFSFNDFTKQEMKEGTMNQLMAECIVFNSANNFGILSKRIFVQKISRNLRIHPYTDIGVRKRLQYTPFQLIQNLRRNGFKVVDLIPINIHPLTPKAKDILPNISDLTSNYLQNRREIYMHVIPQSSSFMITARKI